MKPVNMVVIVKNRDCTPMMRKLISQGWKLSFLFHGDDWDPNTDEDLKKSREYIESVGGRLVLTPYHKEQNTTKIIEKIKGEKS